MGIFGPKPGSWWFKSKSDERYKGSGYASHLSMSGPPNEAEEMLEKLEAKYGTAPDDLEWGFCKD